MTRLKVEEASTALHVLLHSSKVHCSKVHCFVAFKVHLHKQGERERRRRRRRRRKKEIQLTLSQAVPPRRRRLRTENFSQKINKRTSQNPSNTEKTHKTTFSILVFFYWLVWFIFLGWVGFGFETPTANTDVTLPGLRKINQSISKGKGNESLMIRYPAYTKRIR